MNTVPRFHMYGAPFSLFSAKLRSYLRHSPLLFTEHLPSHPDFGTYIMPEVGRVVLPCLRAPDGRVLQDTTEIIDALEHDYGGHAVTPPGALGVLALMLEVFGDEGLLRPAMHYRWTYRVENDPMLTTDFGRMMNPYASQEEAGKLATPLMARMGGLLPSLGVHEDTHDLIEEQFEDLLSVMDTLLEEQPFLLGHRPSVADYGFIGPFWGHLGRDIYPTGLIKRKAPRVWRWIERMAAPLSDTPDYPKQPPVEADWNRDFADFNRLAPLFSLFSQDYAPEIKTLREKSAMVNNQSQELPSSDRVPRSMGAGEIKLRGTDVRLELRPYALWMVGRIDDAVDALIPAELSKIKAFFEEVGLSEFSQSQNGRRVVRRGFREYWGDSQ